MNRISVLLLVFSLISYAANAAVFDLVTPTAKVSILYSKDDRKLSEIAARLLAQDIKRVTGYQPRVSTDERQVSGNIIILGTLGSGLIKNLRGNYFESLKGQWETYSYKVVHNPYKNVKSALVIAGSDMRGTAFGVFGISEKIGVSPWYWWADVNPVKQKNLSLDINDFTSKTPSIKYRGIFINDEDWGLQPWAAKTFEPEVKDIGPKTYSKVFELLLRLKANLIWPAMHPGTKAFYRHPQNKQVAADYEIVVGSLNAEEGLKVPDDVTLLWPDDNHGYIRRLGNARENARKGGGGVYYHASYWGRPHDYLWLSSTHPALMRQEMTQAFEMGARKIWVLNVGDIKPMEYNTQLFLDMAYDIDPFKSSGYTRTHLQNWVSYNLGKDHAGHISEALWQYYQLAFERRPEFMGWSRTEPTSPLNFTQYSHNFYGDEAQKRIDQYHQLEQLVASLEGKLHPSRKNAFYELVLYPLKCASLMNKKFLYRDKAHLYAREGRVSAREYLRLAQDSYTQIVEETSYFNNSLAGGKWKGMMSMQPRNLPVFDAPLLDLSKTDLPSVFTLRPEGSTDSALNARLDKSGFVLPTFNKYSGSKYFIDLFLTKDSVVDYQVMRSDGWIKVSRSSGTLSPEKLKSEQRIWVEIDWSKVPVGDYLSGKITVKSNNESYKITVYAENDTYPELQNFKGFVESDRYVSFSASSYTSSGNIGEKRWHLTEGIGSEKKMLEALPLTVSVDTSIKAVIQNPFVEYEFFNFNPAALAKVHVYTLPAFPLNNTYQMRYAVQVDEGELKILNFSNDGKGSEWSENVLRNNAIKTVMFPKLRAGKHKLRIYMIDPGVVLDKIFISLDNRGLPYSDTAETVPAMVGE